VDGPAWQEVNRPVALDRHASAGTESYRRSKCDGGQVSQERPSALLDESDAERLTAWLRREDSNLCISKSDPLLSIMA